MLFWTIQTTIISIILIFLMHNLFYFFKTTLTVPKIKDLVNAPAQKYENIYNTLNKQGSSTIYLDTDTDTDNQMGENGYENANNPNIKSMKNELKNFLKNKIKSKEDNTTSISSLDSKAKKSISYAEY